MSTDIRAEERVIESLLGEATGIVLSTLDGMDVSDGVFVRNVLIQLLSDVVPAFGGAIAAEYVSIIDKVRLDAGLEDGWRAAVAAAPDVSQIDSRVRWSVEKIFKDEPDMINVRHRVESITMDLVHQQGRQTVFDTVGDSDSKLSRFARVLGATDHCEGCVMLASRGAVYKSAKSARAFWHDNCACKPIPHHKTTSIEGYDTDELYERWKSMVAEREAKAAERSSK